MAIDYQKRSLKTLMRAQGSPRAARCRTSSAIMRPMADALRSDDVHGAIRVISDRLIPLKRGQELHDPGLQRHRAAVRA